MKKHYLLLLLLFTAVGFSQSKIKGVVTYYFNEYQGDKPDVGSKVYVVDSAKVKGFDEMIYYKFNSAKTYRSIYNNYMRLITNLKEQNKKFEGKKKFKVYYDENLERINTFQKSLDDAQNNLVKNDADTDEKFKAIDDKNSSNIMNVTLINKSTETTSVDGAGNYELNVEPGTYYVIIKSNGRNGLSLTEVSGKIHYKKVKVLKDKTVDVSTNFEL